MPLPRSLWSSKRHRENRLHQTWARRGTSPGIHLMPGDRDRPPIRRLQISRRPDLATSMIRTSASARRILPSRIGRRHRSRISRRRITIPSRIGLNRADRPQRSRPIGPSRSFPEPSPPTPNRPPSPQPDQPVPRPSTAVHPRDLSPIARPAPPSTGKPKLDQKYQQQQEKLSAKQDQERQKLQQRRDRITSGWRNRKLMKRESSR